MQAAKQKIKDFALSLGAEDMGVAPVATLPGTSELPQIMPGAQSLLVLLAKEIGSPYTNDPYAAMNGRLDVVSFIRHASYHLARYLEKEFAAQAVTLPYSYPMAIGKSKLPMGIVSLRHAALAAGLGSLGRHNLFMHPVHGSRVSIFALLCSLPLPTDSPLTEDLCVDCGLCVSQCPAGALNEPGRTDVMRCMQNSQPTGMGASAAFFSELLTKDNSEQQKMLRSPRYFNLLQACHMGNQYFCFNCQKTCPVGQ